MLTEAQRQYLNASNVLANAGSFLDAFSQGYAEDLESLEKGKVFLDEAAQALGIYVEFLRNAETERQKVVTYAFEILQAAGYTPAQIAAAKDALNQDPTRKPEKTQTRRTR
ncbi:hypothetical protein [Thauera humireducens]|uniref:Uncharacterized protein n=1 Tax=Thauera humireducens TaxID=1134435 RepID=A0A127K5B7_9RHOO|nr:hypothetical protein [Thauera humireducens]AMO37150.1 hypothetical protein AC731_009405 [Thauera humireducens]